MLENLNDLGGDIVSIKNIDDVVPDRLKTEAYLYKKILCGYLIELQKHVFSKLKKLKRNAGDQKFLRQVHEFTRTELSIMLPKDLETRPQEDQRAFLIKKLNRPLRVCGMVEKAEELGGGPFWVRHSDGSMSLQIVENKQIDETSDNQRKILEASTHFNPVNLVCGIRDYNGELFALSKFVDEKTMFISEKSNDDKKLKALERPGLWNGAMADWNTVFVEVPLITFNPVKTINDLLRKEHQSEY